MISKLRTWTLIFLATSLAGCDGESPDVDAGGSDGGTDAQVETVAPTVMGTLPRDGATEVHPNTSIRITFSEAIDPASGRIAVTVDESEIEVSAPSASEDVRELTFTLSSPLPSNAAVQVVVDGYRDLAGNPMVAEYIFSFTTSDPFAPTVVSSTPAEGETDVAPETEVLGVEFSEPMNAALGFAELEGGPGSIGTPVWDGTRATFPLSGLAPNTAYRVVLRGFADPAGNALDGEPYLGDGALDFTTGDDRTPPVVVESTPREGQSALPPSPTTRVRIVFSEPMDTSAGVAKLDDGSSSTELEASWTGGDRILLLDVVGMLEVDRAYRVTLTGFKDRAGNALDGGPYLGDGALDFTTGEDEPAPFVLYSDPLEGSSGTHWSTEKLFVTFSEEMDTSITSIPYADGISSGSFTAAWSLGGALLEIDVAGQLISGRSYELDFTGLQDQDGIPLDREHAYLGDGKLNFSTAAPKGENCQDFLTSAQATVVDGVYTWTIDASQVTNVDGAAPCDPSGGSADAVVRYTKTSPDSTDASGEGRVLRVTVTSRSTATNKSVNVDVLRDACDPASSVVERLYCGTGTNPQTIDLDVPAGEYFVWVAASTGDFRGATVEIEEIPAGQGDTCRNAIPITAGSTSITPTGTRSISAPSCTGDQALTWYRYTASERLGIITLDHPRAIATMDAAAGEHRFCRSDAVTTPIPIVVEPGQDACIAVASGSPATITIEERPYTGVRGVLTDLNVTYPSGTFGAPGIPLMAVTPSRIYVASTTYILHGPRTGNVVAERYSPPTTVPGNNGLAIGEVFYSLAKGSIDSTNPRPMVLKVTDDTGAFLDPPVPVDTSFPYLDGPAMSAITVDGSDFLFTQGTLSTTPATHFYSVPIAGGPAMHVGSNNLLASVAAIAVDANYIYVIARLAEGGEESEGIYRLRRADLSDPDAEPVLIYGGGLNWPNGTGALYLDSTGGTSWLYFRSYSPAHVHLLLDPDRETPRYLGPIFEQSTNNQTGLAYDPAGPALFLIDHDNSLDRWMRMD